jgi:hypothetical protein
VVREVEQAQPAPERGVFITRPPRNRQSEKKGLPRENEDAVETVQLQPAAAARPLEQADLSTAVRVGQTPSRRKYVRFVSVGR